MDYFHINLFVKLLGNILLKLISNCLDIHHYPDMLGILYYHLFLKIIRFFFIDQFMIFSFLKNEVYLRFMFFDALCFFEGNQVTLNGFI